MLSQERLLWIVQWMTNRTNIYLVLDPLLGLRKGVERGNGAMAEKSKRGRERERERERERDWKKGGFDVLRRREDRLMATFTRWWEIAIHWIEKFHRLVEYQTNLRTGQGWIIVWYISYNELVAFLLTRHVISVYQVMVEKAGGMKWRFCYDIMLWFYHC